MDKSKLHGMEKTNKLITVIGLCFEGVSLLISLIIAMIIRNFSSLFPFSSSWDLSIEEYGDLTTFIESYSYILYLIIFIYLIIVSINVYLFTKLIYGRFSESTAKKVYMYQMIYGGFTLGSNQLIGILYLISGIRGYKGEREETNIRAGI